MWKKWREDFIRAGEFLRGEFLRNVVLALIGIAFAGRSITNVYLGVTQVDESPLEAATEVFYTFLWLMLFFFVIYLFFKGFGSLLIWVGNYRPDWYYLPKVRVSVTVASEDRIILIVSNPKRHKMTLWAMFSVLKSRVRPLPSQADGIAPSIKKQLLSLTPLVGERVKEIARIENGYVIASAGDENGTMTLEKPGVYDYLISFHGEFRGGYTLYRNISIWLKSDGKVGVEVQK